MGDDFCDYDVACTLPETETLEMRREKLCLKFARKDVKKENTLFEVVPNQGRTRDRGKVVHEYRCNTKRFLNRPLPYLAKILNHSETVLDTSELLLPVDYGGRAQQMVLKLTHIFISLLCIVLYHLIMCTAINK